MLTLPTGACLSRPLPQHTPSMSTSPADQYTTIASLAIDLQLPIMPQLLPLTEMLLSSSSLSHQTREFLLPPTPHAS